MMQNRANHFNRLQKSTYLIIVLLIAYVLSSRPIPWATDDVNYLNYAINADVLLDRTIARSFENPLFFFVNEPLWLLINQILGSLVTPETVIRIIIFASVILVLISLGKLTNYSLLTLLLFFVVVQVLKNHILHLRQGLALGFLLAGYAIHGRNGLFLRLLSPFVHTSLWFMLFIEFYEKMSNRIKLSSQVRYFLFSGLSLIIIFAIPILANLTGDRRVGVYDFELASSASFLGFMYWTVMGTTFWIISRKNELTNLSTYGILFYLISYFFLDFGARLFENVVPILVAAMITTAQPYRLFFIMSFILYGALGWYVRGGISF